LSTLVFVAVMLLLTVPENAILRDQANGEILGHSPFISSIVTIIMLFFIVPGVAYGLGAGTIKSDKDVVGAMSKAMSTMGGYLVLAF
ncbi:p-Aminobenzoyl-glutamate transport protein AbgT like protein, partial [Aduncisulcus paluster]